MMSVVWLCSYCNMVYEPEKPGNQDVSISVTLVYWSLYLLAKTPKSLLFRNFWLIIRAVLRIAEQKCVYR